MSADGLVIVVVYPELLGTYGDGGNGAVLARRAQWRGIPAELVAAGADRPLPSADLYCLGGGEDGPEVRAAQLLREEGSLEQAVDRGAVVLAVCAGFQIVGRSFPDAEGRVHAGLGLLDVETVRGVGPRAVGEVVARPDGLAPPAGTEGAALPLLSGFENHAGVTTLGASARPVAQVVRGRGNGDGQHEGAWSGRVLGSYLHGPILARNPALADLLLGWATGAPEPLAPLDDEAEEALRSERLAAVLGTARSRWRGLRRFA
jgi:CobQ-like glutamine amidotransferase family enzyme